MWVRRTAEEIAEDARRRRRRRLNPIEPFLLTIGLILLVFILNGHSSESFFTSPAFPVMFLIFFGLLYLSRAWVGTYRIFGPRLVPPPPPMPDMICARCHTMQAASKSNTCTCGGPLEPVENWRWITDKNAS